MDHLLVKYDYTKQVFGHLLFLYQIHWMSAQTLRYFHLQWISPFRSTRLENLWNLSWPHLVRDVWKERNHIFLKGKENIASQVASNIVNFTKKNLDTIMFKKV